MTAEETRAAELAAFLAGTGWDPDAARPLAGDASNRRYLRIAGTSSPLPGRAIIMDAPPGKGEDVRPFVAVTHWLRGQGFSAPEVLAADLDRGFLALEDLGDDIFTPLLAGGPAALEAELYGAAVDLLTTLADIPAPTVAGPPECRVPLPPYDAAVLGREAALLREWWMPAAGAPVSPDRAAEFDTLVAEATRAVEPARGVVVLRDYHADNLVWLPARTGAARVGLLDYQDALAGHAAYDLVSLLEDARRDTGEALRAAMLARYLERRPALDAEAFRAACAALGAQRNLKIVGIFARLALRDGKPRYLAMIPRVWAHLARDLAHPALTPLAAWVARHVPPPEPDILARVTATARAQAPALEARP